MAERQIEYRKSCLVLSARFPVANWRSRPVAKSAYSELETKQKEPYRGTLSHPSLLPPSLVVLCELGIRLFSSFFCSWRVSLKCSTNWLGRPHVCGTFGEHFTWHTRPHSAVTKEKLPFLLELAPLINFRALNAALIRGRRLSEQIRYALDRFSSQSNNYYL